MLDYVTAYPKLFTDATILTLPGFTYHGVKEIPINIQLEKSMLEILTKRQFF